MRESSSTLLTMDAVYDNAAADCSTEFSDAVLSTPRPSGKRKHSSQQQQRDEYEDGDNVFITPSSSRDSDVDMHDDDSSTHRKKRKTGARTSYSLLSPPPLLPKSTRQQRASDPSEFTETELEILAFPSLNSSSLGSEDDYPVRLSPRSALPPRRFCFGMPEFANDLDCDQCCSERSEDDGSSFSWTEPPFLAMDDDCYEESRRHKIILYPSLRARTPKLSLSIDLSLPSLAQEAFHDEGSAPSTPAAA